MCHCTTDGRSLSIRSSLYAFCCGSSCCPLHIQVLCSRLCSGVNELNKNGETPLHVACRLGRVESVKALLGGGAKCDVIGSTGYPIHTAMKYSEKGWVGERQRLTECFFFLFCCQTEFIQTVLWNCIFPNDTRDWFPWFPLWPPVISPPVDEYLLSDEFCNVYYIYCKIENDKKNVRLFWN